MQVAGRTTKTDRTMANESIGDRLREMAEHRGLKLVKSRRRKAGVGDYGKFGLTDGSGKPLLGIGEDSLTASAEDIQAYLCTDALGTWKQSAHVTPYTHRLSDHPSRQMTMPKSIRMFAETLAPERLFPRKLCPASRLYWMKHWMRGRRGNTNRKPGAPHSRPTTEAPKLAPEPQLVVRPAKPRDAAALAAMLSQLNGISIDDAAARRNLEVLRKVGGGVLLAELGVPIACCCWAVVPTVHRGPVGRVSVLFVDEGHRRKGIATRLLADTATALATKGCTLVEAMSDIEIKNAHNFFRALKFEQASYRFARKIDEGT